MNKTLPKPSEFGRYELDDGSRIYRSAGMFEGTVPDRFFIWIKEGERPGKTVPVAFGYIVMTKDGIMYFDTPQAALEELQSGRLKKEQSA